MAWSDDDTKAFHILHVWCDIVTEIYSYFQNMHDGINFPRRWEYRFILDNVLISLRGQENNFTGLTVSVRAVCAQIISNQDPCIITDLHHLAVKCLKEDQSKWPAWDDISKAFDKAVFLVQRAKDEFVKKLPIPKAKLDGQEGIIFQGKKPLIKSTEKAYQQWKMINDMIPGLTDKEVYAFLVKREEDIGPFDRWRKYVERGRKYYNQKKNTSRRGRSGRSMIGPQEAQREPKDSE
jgi:hypothetical protein